MTKTIFAHTSGKGKAGVAVIRVSGPLASQVLLQLTKRETLPEPRYALLTKLYGFEGDMIDEALILWFKGPHSFTGEDVVEIHTHGSIAVFHALSDFLYQKGGCILAEPGEFTKRAFFNGKLDLTAVEGLADLIDAETTAQRRQALRQLQGELGKLYNHWRHDLLHILAYAEAEIDFADDDIPQNFIEQSKPAINKLIKDIKAHLNDAHCGERIREGIRVAILGAPNVGKSSLINALAKRDIAIVSDIQGTTRDLIEVAVDLKGYPVIFADTAGLRETKDVIEAEGIRRAKAWAENADFQFVLLDAQEGPYIDDHLKTMIHAQTFIVVNKSDVKKSEPFQLDQKFYPISALTGEGLDSLLEALTEAIETEFQSLDTVHLTRLRHREALEETLSHLKRSLEEQAPELVAEDYRLAMRALSRITGHTDVEDLLDVIFRDFCLGK
jgi:tRNA modification GTPase